jgi:hypothetical protein
VAALFFLATVFFAAPFLTAEFLAVLTAEIFFGALFLPAALVTGDFLAALLLAAVFLTVVFLAVAFLAAVFLAAVFLADGAWAGRVPVDRADALLALRALPSVRRVVAFEARRPVVDTPRIGLSLRDEVDGDPPAGVVVSARLAAAFLAALDAARFPPPSDGPAMTNGEEPMLSLTTWAAFPRGPALSARRLIMVRADRPVRCFCPAPPLGLRVRARWASPRMTC